ncbi:MAG TPA: peptidase C14 caspase catalytic subunit p20 [Cyanobacteria bacterium UBA11372]|nr:peptidase C14 caspase catalytic subunit p20 [Cyanobacteria bacterium UBA11372]
MTKNIYALLVGIDNYHPDSIPQISPLKGCVNDIKAVESYLRERIVKDSDWQLVEPKDQPWILLDRDATRQAIINGFQHHLCNADSDDVVLFYYSGHGAQEKAPEEFWELEADRLNETLVCYDSRTEGSRDLADKELRYLISKVARNNPRVIIFLDCCHSGSGTRDLPPEVTVRRSCVDSRERPLSSFIFANDETGLGELLTCPLNPEKKTTGLVLPKGRHVLFSACRDYELAKEYEAEDGQHRGVFSYFLMQTMHRTNGNITYRDLARNINALVSGKVKEQSPQVEASDPEDLDRHFLGGAIQERPTYFTLTYRTNDHSWAIDGGVLHGIPKPFDGENTLLAFFPVASSAEELRQLSHALGEVQVTQVLPNHSLVKIIIGSDRLLKNESYWAVVTSLPLPRLKIYIKGDENDLPGVEMAQQALLTIAPGNKPSLYLHQVDEAKDANYHLLAKNGQYWITHPEDDRPLVAPIPEPNNGEIYTEKNARQVIIRLENIARWNNILQLATPATSRIKTDDVEMEIILLSERQESSQKDGKISSSEMRVEYTYDNGDWQPPNIQIRLTNHSDRKLLCNVLVLSESFAVDVPFFDRESSIVLEPKQQENSSPDIFFQVPDRFVQAGITEYKDILKLTISTTEFDASLLKQDGISLPQSKRHAGGYQGTLNRLMDAVNTREAVKAKGNYDDWMTKEVTITIVRPQDAKEIQAGSSTLLQNGVVELQSHPSLKAKVNLTTVPQASRDLGNLIVPAILRQQSDISQPFQFTTGRGNDPGLSALELSQVEDYRVVTPKSPLKLLVDAELAEDEHILPFAYDGEFFLPLGRAKKTKDGKTEIIIERLVNPTSRDRSLRGSIRIFFEKLVSTKLGRPFEYPILAAVDFDENDKPIYQKNQAIIQARVAKAKRIILYIHGIIGDTESMVPSVRKATVEVNGKQRPIQELYDLVLTFDYENIETTIEDNARHLKQRLQAVGLKPKHGKQLHIVAHSMGGLVSRWFIEREGGSRVVQHLIMLGTPNAGSPWPGVQDWVFAALSIGLNQLSAIVWPTKIVAQLLKFLEEKDYSLDQMQPNSSFLKELAASPDPRVLYTIIAGDRSIVSGATDIQPNKHSPLLKRLMQKLFDPLVDKVVDWTFFSQPNDIAVTVASIKSVSLKRSPKPRIVLPDTACDHLTYFTHPAGLDALAKALYPRQNLIIRSLAAIAAKKNFAGVNGVVISLIALLVAGVIGLTTVWKNTSQQPVERNKPSQVLQTDQLP